MNQWNWVAAVIDPDHLDPPEQQRCAVIGKPLDQSIDFGGFPSTILVSAAGIGQERVGDFVRDAETPALQTGSIGIDQDLIWAAATR